MNPVTVVDQSNVGRIGGSRDELIREFNQNFRINKFTILEKINRDEKWGQWIGSRLKEAIVMYAGYLISTYSSKDECKIGFRAEQWRIGPSMLLDTDFRIVRNTRMRTGNLTLKATLDRIQVRYERGQISFSVGYVFTLLVVLEPSAELNAFESPKIVGQHIFREQFEVASVKPRHLRCWMMNKLSDPNSGVELPSNPTDYEIVYGPNRYATWFVRMVRRFGRNVLRKILDANFVSPETFEIICAELDALDIEYGFADPPDPAQGTDVPFAEPEPGLDIPFAEPEEEDLVNDTPSPIISTAKARNMSEAFRVARNDRQKLHKYADYFKVNGPQALHLSQLGDIVDLSSKSAVSGFLKRMVNAGLITLAKAADDRQVVTIAAKGYDVLSAFG